MPRSDRPPHAAARRSATGGDALTPTETPRARAARTRRLLRRLHETHSDDEPFLVARTPFELLVAVVLSAQCTDERVNRVTPALFARWPDAAALARAPWRRSSA